MDVPNEAVDPGRGSSSHVMPSWQVMEKIAAVCPRPLLAFSGGKDSIAAWVKMKQSGLFEMIIPYYMYTVPGLSFIEEGIKYFEDYFETYIIRVPHSGFWRLLNGLIYQPPERASIIETARLPNVDTDWINKLIIEDCALPLATTYTATGVRAADSIIRRRAVNSHGAINENRKSFWPIWDMNKAELIKTLTDAKIRLPVDYKLFGRSFDGLDYRFVKPIRDHYPEDFEKIKFWFPLIEAEFMRYEVLSDVKKVYRTQLHPRPIGTPITAQ